MEFCWSVPLLPKQNASISTEKASEQLTRLRKSFIAELNKDGSVDQILTNDISECFSNCFCCCCEPQTTNYANQQSDSSTCVIDLEPIRCTVQPAPLLVEAQPAAVPLQIQPAPVVCQIKPAPVSATINQQSTSSCVSKGKPTCSCSQSSSTNCTKTSSSATENVPNTPSSTNQQTACAQIVVSCAQPAQSPSGTSANNATEKKPQQCSCCCCCNQNVQANLQTKAKA
uniref:Uncharacterized protein n=1 Tax=Syphacia muris TaxID=451379 RepID=A0A0N5B187_9BILA